MRPAADCELKIDGVTVPSLASDLAQGRATVLAGLSITWGRRDITEQPGPATCAFSIIDPGGQNARAAVAGWTALTHVGSPVEVWATGPVPGADDRPDEWESVLDDGSLDSFPLGDLIESRYGYAVGSAVTADVIDSPPGALESINAATNPSLEDATTLGWNPNSTAAYPVALDSTSAIGGRYSLVSTRTATTLNNAVASIYLSPRATTRGFPVSPGVKITASVDVKCELAGRQLRAYFQWIDSAGAIISSDPNSIIIPDSGPATMINRVVITGTPPALAATTRIVVNATTINSVPATVGERVWFDQVNVGGSDYFDGDTPNTPSYAHRWTGTIRASTSERRTPDHGRIIALRRSWQPGGEDPLATAPRVMLPPRRFSEPEEAPDAWDDIPKQFGAETYRYSATVRAPAGAELVLYGQGFRSPYWRPLAAVVVTTATATGDWQVITGEFDHAPDSTGEGIWRGLSVGLGAGWTSSIIWAERAGTWAAQPGTWEESGAVYVDQVSVERLLSQDLTRRVLVFSGRVTDLEVAPNRSGHLALNATAADYGSELDNMVIGDDPWPRQAMRDRVARIRTLADISQDIRIDQGLGGTLIAYRDVDAQPVGGLLADLAQSVGGVLWAATHQVTGPYLWIENPDLRAAVRAFRLGSDGKAEIINAANGVTVISACDLQLDPITWVQSVTDVITTVVVTWLDQETGEDGQIGTVERTVTVTDQNAQDRFGRFRLAVATELADETDAAALATRVLAQSNGVGWRLAGVDYDTARMRNKIDSLDDASRALALFDLLDGTRRMGAALTLIDLPDYSPHGEVSSVYVEGGTYEFDWDWSLDLTVTPSAGQGLSAAWESFPTRSWTWAVMGAVRWIDAYGTQGPGPTPKES